MSALTVHTKQELEDARTKGQILGWIQGAGAILVFGVVLKIVGWIPLLLLVGVGGYLAFRVIAGGKDR